MRELGWLWLGRLCRGVGSRVCLSCSPICPCAASGEWSSALVLHQDPGPLGVVVVSGVWGTASSLCNAAVVSVRVGGSRPYAPGGKQWE